MKREKNLILAIKALSVFVVLLVFALAIVLINNHDKSKVEETKKTLFAKVLESYDDFLLVEDEESDKKYTVSVKDKYNEGDYIYITYSKDVEKPDSIEVLITSKENKDNIVIEKEVVTTVSTNSNTPVKNEKKEEVTTRTTVTTIQENKNIDEIIVDYAKKTKETIDTYVLTESNKEKAKTSFCTLVDFIFYDGTIKGHTFKELSSSAKAKVIYYTLLVDGKIDEKWPGYKDVINSKYNDAKLKLVAKYLEICDYVKENQPELYENLKSDFALLKGSVSITWDFVKSALTSAGKFTASKLKSWYETFRG